MKSQMKYGQKKKKVTVPVIDPEAIGRTGEVGDGIGVGVGNLCK